jgi:AAA15 family ATPase/GTPase
MLLGFEFKNWKSFKNETTFSTYASKERQHGKRLSVIPKFNSRISPIGLIFGGNASGKSCFVSAIKFVQEYVLFGEKVLGTHKPFLLSDKTKNEPSFFSMQILVDELIYEYSFSANGRKIFFEELKEINSKSEYILFSRNEEKIVVDPENRIKSVEKKLLKYNAIGTKSNRLFLTNTIDQQIKTWKNIYDWFRVNLLIIHPNTSLDPSVFVEQPDLTKICADELSYLDTGIYDITTEFVDFSTVNIPSELRKIIIDKLDEGVKIQVPNIGKNSFIFEMHDGKIIAIRLASVHKTVENETITFNMSMESDGTLRMLELIPAFSMLNAENSKQVVIIDELDRSLHSKMSLHILEKYLCSCNAQKRSQLIFTTHDMMLMDQSLFRRDEMWLVEKNNEQESELTCMSDFKDIRYDKNIRKSYLEGRMGGIPVLKNRCSDNN